MNRRTTLVTGSRSGMGQAVADLLNRRGELTMGVDVADAEIVADLSTAAGRMHAVEAVISLCPDGIDAIIACAGVVTPDGPKVISTNYFGVIELIEGLHSLLVRGNAPRAVVVASSANMLASDPLLVTACLDHQEERARQLADGNALAYASSKLALTRWVRRTSILPGWADTGILLNGVAPGLVRTAMTAPRFATEEGRTMLSQLAPHATLQAAEAEDIAPLLAFLASAENAYMVGQVPYCDGGKDILLRGDDVITTAPAFTQGHVAIKG